MRPSALGEQVCFSGPASLMCRYARNGARASLSWISIPILCFKIATFARSMCKALYPKHPAPTYDSLTHSSVCIVLEKIQKKSEKFKKTPCQSFLHGVY